jgi:murein DD-endopeptidase MepM/ murein hydrolase activator NlpD
VRALTLVLCVVVCAVVSTGATTRTLSTGATTRVGARAAEPQRFWVQDTHHYTSPWYAGAHRKMINFGCTRAPWYDPSPRCTGDRGFHHGLDVAMRCGTPLYAGFRGRVVEPASAGALGSAYGAKAFRIRNRDRGVDVVLGHVQRVYVAPGERLRAGRLVARAGRLGAPDGCHLHFEVRPSGGGYLSAVRPHPSLMLER